MLRDKLEGVNARAPSPWDKFSTSPSPNPDGLEIEMRRSDGIPRLAPEVEQGNVEYKLILMDPTPERLQRLVTQLNWRLMEGNGEAYYQLGVADSGELIGLTKAEMEATLETLENMAGELGASVIISREIEVRGRLSNLVLESVNGMSRTPVSGSASASGAETSATDTETSEAEGTDDQDTDAADSPGAIEGTTDLLDPNEIIVRSAPVPIMHSFLRRSRKNRRELKDGQESKTRKQLDRDKTLMPQDIKAQGNIQELTEDEASLHLLGSFDDADTEMDPTLGVLELANLQLSGSRRTDAPLGLDTSVSKNKKKPTKGSKPSKSAKELDAANDDDDINESKSGKGPTPYPKKTPEDIAKKMADKRAKRDKRREERKRALLDPVYDHGNVDFGTQDGVIGGIAYDTLTANEVSGTDDDNDGTYIFQNAEPVESNLADFVAALRTPVTDPETESVSNTVTSTETATAIPIKAASAPCTGTATPIEPRLIVEALVVRKAGFGRGFVDLSQFDEELRHLPSFSLI